ncbi:phosphate acetyltransferase [Ruminococcaceae bacterium OttesenSCG-928-A16]|nr:phosphate acetyltransferase [Ruminococcaceae bacterium OttesenSCG-928-A16]
MFEKMIGLIQGKNRKIVFTEGYDARILKAAEKLYQDNLMLPVLLGVPEKVLAIATQNQINLNGIEIIDPETCPDTEAMVAEMVTLRKGKMTEEECRAALKKANYFGTMMVKMGMAHGLLGGATYSTADTVRPALQIVKTKPGQKIVSSCFVLNRTGKNGTNERYMMGDCAINLNPSDDELVEITTETAACARLFDIEPRVALLSYSTFGSGKGDSVSKVQSAVQKLKAMKLDFAVDGELQFDAAIAPEVAQIKAPDSLVAGKANTFIFPNIDSGNIGYKIAQRLGGFEAFGPILLGLNAPINDLSRGCTVDEIYKLAIITMAQGL